MRCRFFVVPLGGPVLLGMSDIKLLNILKVMCEVIGDPHDGSFDSKTVQASNSPGHRTNRVPKMKTDKVDTNDTNANIPYYFRSSTKRAADKRACEALTNKTHNEFSDVFFFRHRLL